MEGTIISFIVKSSLSSTILFLLYWLFLRKEKTFRFNRFYLLTSAIISLIIPLINFSKFWGSDPAIPLANLFPLDNLVTTINSETISSKVYALSNNIEQFNFWEMIAYIYVVIAFGLFLKFVIGLVRVSLLARKNPQSNQYGYTIVYVKENYSPFSFFNFIFMNDKMRDKQEYQKIVEHEKVHIKQLHSLDIIITNVISVIQWFNPFIWLIQRSLKATHEFLADEEVIAQGFDSVSYSELLLNQIVGVRAAGFANSFSQPLIKKRIIMMGKIKPGLLAYLKIMLILPLAIFLLAFSNIPNDSNHSNKTLEQLLELNGDEIPKGWFEAGMNPTEYEINIDENVTYDGRKSVRIKSLNPSGKDFGNLLQVIDAENYLGKRLRFSGYIKTENVEGNGAALWMRVDGEDKKSSSLVFDNMYGRAPTGTTDWQKFEIVLDIPDNGKNIVFGLMLSKKGTAWFSNLKIEEVDETIPITDLKANQSNIKRPDKPVNLGFDE